MIKTLVIYLNWIVNQNYRRKGYNYKENMAAVKKIRRVQAKILEKLFIPYHVLYTAHFFNLAGWRSWCII